MDEVINQKTIQSAKFHFAHAETILPFISLLVYFYFFLKIIFICFRVYLKIINHYNGIILYNKLKIVNGELGILFFYIYL